MIEKKNQHQALLKKFSPNSGTCPKQDLDEVEIICYDRKINVPQNMCRHVLDWYHEFIKCVKEDEDRSKIHALMWDVYMKEGEELING